MLAKHLVEPLLAGLHGEALHIDVFSVLQKLAESMKMLLTLLSAITLLSVLLVKLFWPGDRFAAAV